MAKFILPESIVKIKPNSVRFEPGLVWPIGTLYLHVPSGHCFRFLPLGGRWNKTYGISTDHGIFTATGLVRMKAERKIEHPDKNVLIRKFIDFFDQAPAS